jgi:GT2 family glycosyltransferase
MPTRVVVWLPDGVNKISEAELTEAAIARQTIQVSGITDDLSAIEPDQDTWVWILNPGSEPKSSALAELLAAVADSTTVGQVGPMQLSRQNPKLITQLGLSLSPLGAPVGLISNQLDQAQHTAIGEVMAVSLDGSLIRSKLLQAIGMPNFRLPGISTDLDFSIRIRRAGFRVLTVPTAKVVVPALALKDDRRAAIQLRLAHSPLPLALLYWLFLPVVTTVRLVIRLSQKRPGLLVQELWSGLWGFITIPARLASRPRKPKASLRSLRPLRASWLQTADYKRHEFDLEESHQRLAAFIRGDHENTESAVKSFADAGGFWVAFSLLAVSWTFLPQSDALSGGSLLPLSSDWFDLFARAGASWQPIGQGFFGPSDPFNWVLLLIGSFTFWSPNLAVTLLLLLSRSFAFMTAWKAFSLLTAKSWQRNLGATLYALLPAFTASLVTGELAAIVVTILTPWLAFSIARAAGLGRSGSAASDARTWSWVGLSGVLLAFVTAASPSVGILALAALAVAAFTRIRRFGYLFWIPLPMAAIYLPLIWYQVAGLGQPLALLANPTIGHVTQSDSVGALVDLSNPIQWSLGLLLVIALVGVASKRWGVALALAVFGLTSYALLAFTTSLAFPADVISAELGFDRVENSGHDIASVLGIVTIALAVVGLSQVTRKWVSSLGLIALLAVSAPLAFGAATSMSELKLSNGSVVPLLLQKQAEQGTDLQLLKITKTADDLRVQWMPIAGIRLEDANLAYRFSVDSIGGKREYQSLAQAIGDLSAANGMADMQTLISNKVGYILMEQTAENADLAAALESSPNLEGAGLTPFGELWRVKGIGSADAPASQHTPWSLTKAVQLISLFAFMLLAVPTRTRRKRAEAGSIFIDQSESELNV